jgi:hypothetical protein
MHSAAPGGELHFPSRLALVVGGRSIRLDGVMRSNRSIPAATAIPILSYPDVRAAVAWLAAAFGFIERVRIGDDHWAQLSVGDGAVIVADTAGSRRPPDPTVITHSVTVRVAASRLSEAWSARTADCHWTVASCPSPARRAAWVPTSPASPTPTGAEEIQTPDPLDANYGQMGRPPTDQAACGRSRAPRAGCGQAGCCTRCRTREHLRRPETTPSVMRCLRRKPLPSLRGPGFRTHPAAAR